VTPSNGIGQDTDPEALFKYVGDQLAPLGLAFVHVIEGATGGARDVAPFDFEALRQRVKAPWIVNNGYDRAMAVEAMAGGHADAVAFGRPFISNPDLVQRLRVGAEFAPLQRETLYGGGVTGYTDYPTLAA
jgi:N-ethylmaleimide reductase